VRTYYDANTSGFRDKCDRYFGPDGVNLALAGKLTDLRKEIEGYAGAAYAAAKAAITATFTACSPGDQSEVAGNRAWRDVVEQKFPVAAERTEIKTILATFDAGPYAVGADLQVMYPPNRSSTSCWRRRGSWRPG